MADSSGSLVASQRVTMVSMLHVDAKEISNLHLSSLFISPSRILRFSQQTLRFSAPMLAKVKAPNIKISL